MNEKISELLLFKNNQFCVFNKPAGMPVIPDLTNAKNLLQLAQMYVKFELFPVHRIDRPVSGLVVFANSSKSAAQISQQFKERQSLKEYLAVVENKPKQDSGNLTHKLWVDKKKRKSFVSDDAKAKTSTLNYEFIESIDNYHLLKVVLETGRFHQIRAQLSAENFFIKGDIKYGARRKNSDRSIHLHSRKITFLHPVSKESMTFEAPVPDEVVWKAFKSIA